MNREALKASLIAHEGKSRKLYTCTAGKPSIGVGRNLEKPLSDAAIDFLLEEDMDEAVAELNRAFPTWTMHSEVRQTVLAELMFNLGAPRLARFKRFWAAMAKTDYDTAAYELMSSIWAVQVGQRAVTLSERMRNG